MGQGEITKILQSNYPKWLSYKEITTLSGLNRRTVMRNLKSLRKRDEVEIMENQENLKWLISYRIKE